MSEVLSGAGSGAAIGASFGGAPGALIGAGIGAVSGFFGGRRKRKAQKQRSSAMQDAMKHLKVDYEKERESNRATTKKGMDWYKTNVLDTAEGKAAYAKMEDDATMQDILKRRKAQADEGMGAAQMQAYRNLDANQMNQAMAQLGLQMGSQLQNRKGQAISNVIAGQQRQSLEGLAEREMQRQLSNERFKQQGLDDYQETYTAQKMYDIKQAKDQLGSMVTYGTTDAERESNIKNQQRQLEAKMALEAGLARAESTSSGGFLGLF